MESKNTYNYELNKAIKESGIRKNFLAAKIGITPQKLSQIISGEKAASIVEKKRIAIAININVHEVFKAK